MYYAKPKGKKRKFGRYNKYKNIRQTYNGVSYHSRLEAQYAKSLDDRMELDDSHPEKVKEWQGQVKVDLRVNNIHICNYYMDFLVTKMDGTEEWIEVKGFDTTIWKLKAKMFEAIYPDRKYIIVRAVK